MVSVRTLQFNAEHNRNYSDEELNSRFEEAEPYLLFQYFGGAHADYGALGDYLPVWIQIRKRAINAAGTDDPVVIDDWVEKERRRILGVAAELDAQAPDEVGDLPSLLGGANA